MDRLLEPRKRFSRSEIRERLTGKTAEKHPILVTDAGIGLVAKMSEAEGIDLITATSEARLRMMGQPSCVSYLAVGNANDLAFDALRRVTRMARQTPVICGIAPGDPYRDIGQLVEEARVKGADGIITLPAANGFGKKLDRDVAGSILNSEADLRLIEYCNEAGLFTIAVSFDCENAKAAAAAGADVIVAHAGFTVGGLSGAPAETAGTLEEVYEFTAELTEAAHRENPDSFVLCHGGFLNTPERVQECLARSGAQGMFGGSVFDRIPIEDAITDVVSRLEALCLQDIQKEAEG